MHRIAILICFGLMLGVQASAQDVRTNYMPGTDFSKYQTYAWVEEVKGVPRVGGQPDQILDVQVKQAVDSQMAAKGFTKVVDGGKADLLLGFQLAIDREKQLNGFADGSGGWGGHRKDFKCWRRDLPPSRRPGRSSTVRGCITSRVSCCWCRTRRTPSTRNYVFAPQSKSPAGKARGQWS